MVESPIISRDVVVKIVMKYDIAGVAMKVMDERWVEQSRWQRRDLIK